MSADFETEHFKIYEHPTHVWVVWKDSSGGESFSLDEELVSEFQEIIDLWKSNE